MEGKEGREGRGGGEGKGGVEKREGRERKGKGKEGRVHPPNVH